MKVDKIFHKILWLDIFESSMLTELVNEKLGLVMTKKQRRQLEARMAALEKGEAGGGGGASQEQEEEEAKPALVDVKLVAFDAKQKIKVIKVGTNKPESTSCLKRHDCRKFVVHWNWV